MGRLGIIRAQAAAERVVAGILFDIKAFRFWCALAIWLFNFAMSGWVNANRREAGQTSLRYWSNRILQTACAVLPCPFTASFTVIALITTLYMGTRGHSK